MIFVFGSNDRGIHGAGAARTARERYGAEIGVAEGPTGHSYALPTMTFISRGVFVPMRLDQIQFFADRFKIFARDNLEHKFQVTRVGCGLGGQKDEDIAPMFIGSPSNCLFDTVWRKYLPAGTRFWGTF